jgi:hypothetical protein
VNASPVPQADIICCINSTTVQDASENEVNILFFFLLWNKPTDIKIVDVASLLNPNYNMSAKKSLRRLFPINIPAALLH